MHSVHGSGVRRMSADDRNQTLRESALDIQEYLDKEDIKSLAEVGVLPDVQARSATLVVKDHDTACVLCDQQDFELLPLAEAFRRYNWLEKEYSFKAVAKDYDAITQQCANQEKPLGVFIRVKKGAQVQLPCQIAMYMTADNSTQTVHNIVILEEGSRLELITGCVSKHEINGGVHQAVEEYYIGKDATFVSTMVHSWGKHVTVYPRSGAVVGENGRYESNYISMSPAMMIESNPQTYLNGNGASAQHLTIVLGVPGSHINTDGNVYLNAENTSAELLHRGVCTGGKMHQGGLIIANASGRGHVDCAGMLLDAKEEGYIQSVPGLRSYHPDARLSHEASIGKIAPEQLEYLMSRGMDEREAISLLIRGFLGADVMGLGVKLDEQIAEIAEIAGHGEG